LVRPVVDPPENQHNPDELDPGSGAVKNQNIPEKGEDWLGEQDQPGKGGGDFLDRRGDQRPADGGAQHADTEQGAERAAIGDDEGFAAEQDDEPEQDGADSRNHQHRRHAAQGATGKGLLEQHDVARVEDGGGEPEDDTEAKTVAERLPAVAGDQEQPDESRGHGEHEHR